MRRVGKGAKRRAHRLDGKDGGHAVALPTLLNSFSVVPAHALGHAHISGRSSTLAQGNAGRAADIGREMLPLGHKLAVVPAHALRDAHISGTTILSAVIPGRRASGEPGIHNPRLWLWIPGLRLAAHPGMTAERVVVPEICACPGAHAGTH